MAGLKYVVVEQQLLPASVSRSQSNAGVMAQGLIRMRGCPRKQCWFSSEPLAPHLSFPPREAVQLAGAGAAEVPLLLEAALPGEAMLAWWGLTSYAGLMDAGFQVILLSSSSTGLAKTTP